MLQNWQCIWPANPPGLDLWLLSHALPLPLHEHSTDPVYQINKLTSAQEADCKTLSHSWAAIRDTQKNFDTDITISHFPPREILLLMAVQSQGNNCQPTTQKIHKVIKYKEETEETSAFWHTSLSPTFTLSIALSALNPSENPVKTGETPFTSTFSYPSPWSS